MVIVFMGVSLPDYTRCRAVSVVVVSEAVTLPDSMVPMASQTGGGNMRAIIDAPGRWGLMVSAEGEHNLRGIPDDRVVGIDNGIVSVCNREARARGLKGFQELDRETIVATCAGWDPAPFEKIIGRFGARATFAILPDIIAGGVASIGRSREWIDWTLARCELALLPVQDGMAPDDVAGILGPRVGIFVGGLDEWKERTAPALWGPLARRVGCWLHVGRVNTTRRIAICQDAGAHSFDGTSVSIYRKNLRKLDGAARQQRLFSP
jgi:hypothetical protein